MYPIETRNALYTLFRAFLDHPEAREPFSKADLEPLRAAHPHFVADRVPRYQRVLKALKQTRRREGLAAEVRLGQELFNAGLFFDCHEVLEGAWRGRKGAEKDFLQGLIQAAAALHKLEQEPLAYEGALYLMDRGLKRIETGLPLLGAKPSRLVPLIEIRNRLVAGRLDLDSLPRLAVV